MGELKGKLIDWNTERPTERSRLAVLVCIPTSRWRFAFQPLFPKAIWSLVGLWSDYVFSQRLIIDYWQDYGRPIVQLLQHVARSGVVVVKDAKLDDVAESIAAGKTELLIFGHNPFPEAGGVEFHDGYRDFDEIRRVVAQGDRDGRVTVYFNVCYSWTAKQGTILESGQRFGALPFQVGLKWSLLFCRYWIEELDGSTTLYDAWHRAANRYLKDPRLTGLV